MYKVAEKEVGRWNDNNYIFFVIYRLVDNTTSSLVGLVVTAYL